MTEEELRILVDRLLDSQKVTDGSIRLLSDGVSGLASSMKSIEARVDSLHVDVAKTRDVTVGTAAKLEAHQDVHHALNDRLREMRTEHDEDITGVFEVATSKSSDDRKKPSFPPFKPFSNVLREYKEFFAIIIAVALATIWLLTGQQPEEVVSKVREAAEEARYQALESRKATTDVVDTVEDLSSELESLKKAIERKDEEEDG